MTFLIAIIKNYTEKYIVLLINFFKFYYPRYNTVFADNTKIKN